MSSPTDVIQPGQSVQATCAYSRGFADVGVLLRLGAPTSAGWDVRMNAGGGWTAWSTGAFSLEVDAGWFTSGHTFTIQLRAPLNAIAGTPAVSTSLTVSRCTLLGGCSSSVDGSATLSASIAPLDADDMRMTCAPTSPSVPRGDSTQVTCTISALPGLGTSSLVVRSVTISAPPSGWAVTTSPVGTSGAGGAVTIPTGQILAPGQSWSFTITLSPACTAPATGQWAISSQVANTNGAVTSPNIAGPRATLSATAFTQAPGATASTVSHSLQWSMTSAFVDQTRTGALIYQIDASGCAGWTVSISASPFTSTGGETLPADTVGIITTGVPRSIDGSLTGVSASGAVGGLDESRTVLTARPGTGTGTYQQEIGVAVTVPAGTGPGSYQSTITITTSAAP